MMTKFCLDFDQKILTLTNLNVGTWPKFTTTTNINFTPQKYAGAVGLNRSPSPGLQACTGWDTCPALLRYSKRKTSGTEVRRTPDIRLRFVGLIRFDCFNLGHVQLLMFVIVMVWSYSFGHLESVKWIFLF